MNRAPLIVAVFLLLLPMYVVSYLALVTPGGFAIADDTGGGNMPISFVDYRVSPSICAMLFWPLEKIDRKARPKSWQRPSGLFDSPRARQIENNLGVGS